MKHIGWCLDKIPAVMMPLPKTVDSQEDKDKANKIMDKVQELATTLAELIHHPKFRDDLKRLENSNIPGLVMQAHEIEALAKDLEHAMFVLDQYIKEMGEIIANRPELWKKTSTKILNMIAKKFCDDYYELRKEFQAVTHTEEELKKLVSSEEHLAEFLK